jgi:hypothetical protein
MYRLHEEIKQQHGMLELHAKADGICVPTTEKGVSQPTNALVPPYFWPLQDCVVLKFCRASTHSARHANASC